MKKSVLIISFLVLGIVTAPYALAAPSACIVNPWSIGSGCIPSPSNSKSWFEWNANVSGLTIGETVTFSAWTPAGGTPYTIGAPYTSSATLLGNGNLAMSNVMDMKPETYGFSGATTTLAWNVKFSTGAPDNYTSPTVVVLVGNGAGVADLANLTGSIDNVSSNFLAYTYVYLNRYWPFLVGAIILVLVVMFGKRLLFKLF